MYIAIILRVLKLDVTITTCITQAFMCSYVVIFYHTHACKRTSQIIQATSISIHLKHRKTSMFASEINTSKSLLIQERETFLQMPYF